MKIYLEHLHAAWAKVQQGSRAAGVDGLNLDLFDGIAEERIAQLHQQLRRNQYQVACPLRR